MDEGISTSYLLKLGSIGEHKTGVMRLVLRGVV